VNLNAHLNAALRAHICSSDRHYVVQDGDVVIVDEFTGRLMPGPALVDGLHQAIEPRRTCRSRARTRTLASITFQKLLPLYRKLAGMTGTADTEATSSRRSTAWRWWSSRRTCR